MSSLILQHIKEGEKKKTVNTIIRINVHHTYHILHNLITKGIFCEIENCQREIIHIVVGKIAHSISTNVFILVNHQDFSHYFH